MRRSLCVAFRCLAAPMFVALAVSAVLLLIPSIASAQAVTGTLLGNVTDSSGAAVPGATVTATNQATRDAQTAVTSTDGRYSLSLALEGIAANGAEPRDGTDPGRAARRFSRRWEGADRGPRPS
jgi:hypothetical protein